ncbi:hypothetical protein PPACK8108_LOCUS12459 [Phakopsora pachyrhizi]|uniref:Nucleolar protein 16 n=1 Tax=Phakopsora pachyrhizi TaxID=170000 RepID=A0AAV0B447_PHAPC|nr:hypothetical protein PPACK8108_LOCUS12459 [Phakopsora pachyrhizi]
MPRAKNNQATANNLSGHLASDDYDIISAWLIKPSNYSSCFVKQEEKLGLHHTSKQMKDCFKTYISRYVKAKKESLSKEAKLKKARNKATQKLAKFTTLWKFTEAFTTSGEEGEDLGLSIQAPLLDSAPAVGLSQIPASVQRKESFPPLLN